jgi:predicted phosphate transport protein (TIGR00153 family)
MAILFKKTRVLENQIDEFFDAVSQGGIVFKQGMSDYMDGRAENFKERLILISRLENKADDIRRKVETQLYSHSLIPEHRGDVLGLLENMDDVIDTAKSALIQFSTESPDILPELKKEYMELTEMAVLGVESVVLSARAFFRDVAVIKDYLHKVYFYEKEADKIVDRLTRHIFDSNIELSRKIHLRFFAFHIEHLADAAENVADRLAIYAIKRTL